MEMLLKNELVVVTGASRGLGEAVARAAHREGAWVVINYFRNPDRAADLVKEFGARSLAISADVRSKAEVQQMILKAEAWANRPVSGLVNNALVDYKFNGDARDRLENLEWSAMQQQLEGSVAGSLNALQACYESMRKLGCGSVVNIGTNLFQNPVVPYHDYTASKGALLALTRTAANEWGPQGIRVNMVSGGLLRKTDASAATPDAVFDLIAANTPLRHVTTPAEMADAVILLLSALARGVTGQNLVVDGGLVMN
jgi:3-oxoacyl-[acyl-carrier protein] reductase